MRIGAGPLRSISAGILEFGLTATKPLPNWLPSILISHASYSAPRWPSASSSSSITVTLTPFGVASEYSCSGWRPTGNSLSCVGPAIGRLMLANLPPLSLFQLQTLGGVYSAESLIDWLQASGNSWDVLTLRRVERREAAREIGLEVLDILQPDMEAQRRTARRPGCRGAVRAAVEGNDEALAAAPGITHAAQFYGGEQGVDGSLRLRLQHDAEQAGGAGKIAFPDRM